MPPKSRFTRLDAFAKTVEDARIRTASGGIVTIASILVILWLIWGEWVDYRRIAILPELVVDKSRGAVAILSCFFFIEKLMLSARRENGDSPKHDLPATTMRTFDLGCDGCIRGATSWSGTRSKQSTPEPAGRGRPCLGHSSITAVSRSINHPDIVVH